MCKRASARRHPQQGLKRSRGFGWRDAARGKDGWALASSGVKSLSSDTQEIPVTRLFSLAALAVVGALLLAACGGSSTSGSSTSSSSGASSTPGYGAAAPKATSSSSSASVVSTKTSALGTFLVDASGRALYLWDADHGSMSACTAACAQAWPPLTTTGTPKAGGAVKASLLGTTKRADGSREVTYAGHPLYTFSGDTQAGQTTGEGNNGFGAPWWVVTPGGAALQH
jgi:predicted lipoprotein with Yx(FWY)xxD motif